jgi:hypothetical protein
MQAELPIRTGVHQIAMTRIKTRAEDSRYRALLKLRGWNRCPPPPDHRPRLGARRKMKVR